MENLWLVSFLSAVIVAATPILYASVGEILSERAGVMNLGLEGVMLLGAVSGYIVVVRTQSLLYALLAVILVGLLIGLLFALLTVTLQANQTVCGLSVTIFGTGLSGFMGKLASSNATPEFFQKIAIPGLSRIPYIGPIVFRQDLLVYSLYVLVALAYFLIYRTRPGMKLRAVGENPNAADYVGINIYRLRYLYVCLGCILTAVGGAYISLAYSPMWIDGMTAGRGWIAIALVVFSGWNPLFAAAGALLFGGIDVLGLRFQAMGVSIPSHFISMLPYISTVLVLIVSTGSFGNKRSRTPKALGTPYDRECR